MRSSNPLLNSKTYSASTFGQEVMTKQGTYLKTSLLVSICFFVASLTFTPGGVHYRIPAIIAGLILLIITLFKKNWAPFTAPLYAACQGAALGGLSYVYYHLFYPGIIVNTVLLTFGVFILMLYLYQSKTIVVTNKLRTGIIATTGAIALTYLVSFLLSFFGISIPFIHSSGLFGIGFSFLVVGIAAFNLLLDFDFIENVSNSKSAPQYLEWFSALSLLVTLVWLYIEILHLLSKLNRRR